MSVSDEAKADQAGIGYSLDAWQEVTVPIGTLLYAGYHGAPSYGRYFTDRETMLAHADGKFTFMLWGVLQVKPHGTYGDRQAVREFRVMSDLHVSGCAANANASAYWGGSGGYQYFIPDRFHAGLIVTREIPLSTTGII